MPEVEVRRSPRRRRTVSAYREGDKIIVLIPAATSKRDEAIWVERMVAKIETRERRTQRTDDDLMARATYLNKTYLGGEAQPSAIRWVTNQRSRWGSCTPADRAIRLSARLQTMPAWVIDYVIVHELAHLLEAHHNARFHALVGAYPKTEVAKAYLDGFSAGTRSGEPISGDVDEVED
ncbi:metal-dependent hydrolase [Nocardioides baekrokdamisoli]|uniref:Metal-dependent hydrolase n=1 Tax=Nocardioides baekrokdamisoli TaxID=1804624 RepID=A0A3G9IC31_9ACTN|nr:M48 family metallopeptidase [Nocardioides baekrokdamisoli]BBH16457.1 metal-dependent hydrolase [Nocardioides baekrokdamisoli]